jgi:hypothetical protein
MVLTGDVAGGRAGNPGSMTNTTANGNNVLIKDSSVKKEKSDSWNDIEVNLLNDGGSIVGGWINESPWGMNNPQGTRTAINNTVTLEGKVDFGKYGSIFGGLLGSAMTPYSYSINGVDIFTGNTLNVVNYTGSASAMGIWEAESKAYMIANFEKFNFTIPLDTVRQGGTVLATKNLVLGDGNGKPSYVESVQWSGAAKPGLTTGQFIYLINAENTQGEFKNGTVTAKWGSLLEQDLNITKTNNGIMATAATDNQIHGGLPMPLSNSQAAPSVGNALMPVFNGANLSSVMESGKTAVDFEIKPKGTYVRDTDTVGHRRGWKSLTPSERAERKASRREAWINMSEDERNALREKRQAHMGNRPKRGALFE